MNATAIDYKNILVAMDFSPYSEAALQQALWIARNNRAKIVLAHVLKDLRHAVHVSSAKAKLDLVQGEGEYFQREVRHNSDARMQRIVDELAEPALSIEWETLLGEPFVELIHAVEAEKYDLVLAGTRGLSAWEQFFVGSTAKRLLRKCPSHVWIVKQEHACAPRAIVAATDFSEASVKAAAQAVWIARQSHAKLHLVHAIDPASFSPSAVGGVEDDDSVRDQAAAHANKRFARLLEQLAVDRSQVQVHLPQGAPWKEICRVAQEAHADLIALGTVGHSGIRGLLLGGTAEKVLTACDSSVLCIKPDSFVSPIEPAAWELHPARSSRARKDDPS